MTGSLDLEVRTGPEGSRVVYVRGEMAAEPLLEREADLVSLTVEARREVVLELSGVTALDGQALALLQRIARAMRGGPGRLVIADPSPAAFVALRGANFHTLIPVVGLGAAN